jgi:uncharacterized caspase-like protein
MGISLGQTFHTHYRSSTEQGNAAYHALYIAIDRYIELAPLRACVMDSEALEDVLSHEYGVATFQKLHNEEATHGRIRQALSETGQLSPDDTLLIVFSGHSINDARDGMDFWLPCDAGSDTLDRHRWLPFASVLAAMTNTPARHVLLINASTGPLSSLPVTRDICMAKESFLEPALRYRSREIITDGLSVDSEHIGLSPFMYHLVQGLHTHSETWIDSFGMFEYVRLGMKYTEASYVALPSAGHQSGGSTVLFRTGIEASPR